MSRVTRSFLGPSLRNTTVTAQSPGLCVVRCATSGHSPRLRPPCVNVKKTVASGRALALIVLAVGLVRVLFLRMFGAVTGLALFQKNYGPDRLTAVTPRDRGRMPTFSRCIACGRCDLGEGERMRASNGAYPGLMQLVLASSRSMPDYDAAARGFAFVPVDVLRQKRRVCPTDVPFDDVAQFVREASARVASLPSATANE